MTLPVSPASISMSQINTELTKAASSIITLNDGAVRTLLGKPSGIISMADAYGKSSIPSVYFIGVRKNTTLNRWVSTRSYDGGATITDIGTLPSGLTSTPNFVGSDGTRIVVGVTYTTSIYYSLDKGVTWNTASLPSLSYWSSIAYGNGYFVITAGGNGSTAAAYSSDCVTWTASTMPYSSFWNSLSYSPSGFFAVNQAGYYAYSSTGATWTGKGRFTLPASAVVTDAVYANGYYIVNTVFGTNGAVVLRSTDGTNFSTVSAGTSTSNQGQKLSYLGNNTWVTTVSSIYTKISRSTDNGASWSDITVPVTSNSGGLSRKILKDSLNNCICPTNYYSASLVSTDNGATWSTRSIGNNNTDNYIAATIGAVSIWS